MSDNSYDTDLRPVHAGRAQPRLRADARRGAGPSLTEVTENGTEFGDTDPTYDDCSKGSTDRDGTVG